MAGKGSYHLPAPNSDSTLRTPVAMDHSTPCNVKERNIASSHDWLFLSTVNIASSSLVSGGSTNNTSGHLLHSGVVGGESNYSHVLLVLCFFLSPSFTVVEETEK